MAATTQSVASSSQITYVGSGSAIAAAGIMVSSDISTALVASTNLAKYPLADLALAFAPTASIAAASSVIHVYRRDAGEPLPLTNTSSTYKQHYVGSFTVKNNTVSTAETVTYVLSDVPLNGLVDCEFYIENGTAINIPAGWTLKVTPKTFAAA